MYETCQTHLRPGAYEVMKGLLRHLKFFRLATVLDVRRLRSDEKVASARENFAPDDVSRCAPPNLYTGFKKYKF